MSVNVLHWELQPDKIPGVLCLCTEKGSWPGLEQGATELGKSYPWVCGDLLPVTAVTFAPLVRLEQENLAGNE